MADIRAQITRVRDAANDAATTATDKIKDSTGKARESASELISTGRDKANEAYGDARDRTQKVAARANEIVQEHPIAAVAGAVAVGAVLAWMFPKSRRAMKAVPGLATTVGAKFVEAAIAARAAAADGAQTVKDGANATLHRAGSAASVAKSRVADATTAVRGNVDAAVDSASDTLASSDLSAKASRLADDVASLVVAKVEALSDTIKARLPKS